MGGFGNLFGGGSSKTSSSTSTTDASANSGSGVALSGASTLNIMTADPAIAAGAFGLAGQALTSNANLSSHVVDKNAALSQFAINTIKSVSDTAAQQSDSARQSADLAIQNSQGLVNRLSDYAQQSAAASQAPDTAAVKTLVTPVLWAVGALVALLLITRNSK